MALFAQQFARRFRFFDMIRISPVALYNVASSLVPGMSFSYSFYTLSTDPPPIAIKPCHHTPVAKAGSAFTSYLLHLAKRLAHGSPPLDIHQSYHNVQRLLSLFHVGQIGQ